jgi:SAM-dependent methyltransferase
MTKAYMPSIWLGDFHSKAEFEQAMPRLKSIFTIYDWIDDRLLLSRHRFVLPAYCVGCDKVTYMRVDWRRGNVDALYSVQPAWTETVVCECGLNSRMRALLDFLKTRFDHLNLQDAYILEQVTPLYQVIKSLNIARRWVGSEYCGPQLKGGKLVPDVRRLRFIRHEDLTALSFSDASFDLVVTLDVFEHIPQYQRAFSEVYRVLRSPGYLVFTIPFFSDNAETRVRATVNADGTITHHLPPEIHGNPLSKEGSLCFQNFGWDILDALRATGFANAFAALYWGPWQGHLGYPLFVFCAIKGKENL